MARISPRGVHARRRMEVIRALVRRRPQAVGHAARSPATSASRSATG
ncbi:MAG: hypothetical protein ACJA0A_000796, partial [Acidimicrobiales bacterium]